MWRAPWSRGDMYLESGLLFLQEVQKMDAVQKEERYTRLPLPFSWINVVVVVQLFVEVLVKQFHIIQLKVYLKDVIIIVKEPKEKQLII